MTPLRPCLDCGIRTRTTAPRCGPCERTRQRRRNQDPRRLDLYNNAHRRRSRAAREHLPCAICGTRIDLTWDHEHGQVECRPCNSSHRRNPT